MGVTFSYRYAEYLGLNWRDAYTATLDELGVKRLRVPMHWDHAEVVDDVYTTEQIDWILDEAVKRDAQVTLVVGMKVPRWPECYIPDWVSDENLTAELLEYVAFVVDRYKAHPAIAAWQVENEPFLTYGDCPTPEPARIKQEVDLVRDLDPRHPIVMTMSGEFEAWVSVSRVADVVGTSLYRSAWNDILGPAAFPYPAALYRVQRFAADLFADKVIVSELQMEPWFSGGGRTTETKSVPFTVQTFVDNLSFVHRAGFEEVWLWGVEWWYFVRQEGDHSLWNVAQDAFKE